MIEEIEVMTLPCAWCRCPMDATNYIKVFVCEVCIVPRLEAARILRSGEFNSQRWRAARIIESPRVEEHLISDLACIELGRMAIVRDGLHYAESRRRQGFFERWRIILSAWAYSYKRRLGRT